MALVQGRIQTGVKGGGEAITLSPAPVSTANSDVLRTKGKGGTMSQGYHDPLSVSLSVNIEGKITDARNF